MKRFLMLVAVAAVAGAMYVAAAPGSRQAAPPTAKQFALLKKQVAKLKKTLTALKKDETLVKTEATDAAGFIATCFVSTNAGAVPVGQFGDPNGTFGFQYITAAGVTTPTLRTALDLDASTTPQGFLQAVDPSCISSASAAPHTSSSRLSARAERAR
jgi:hypothetical protein